MAAPDLEAGPVDVRRIEALNVIALRHLPEAIDVLAAALRAAGVVNVPSPGQVVCDESSYRSWALWRSPSEVTLMTFEPVTAQAAIALLTHTRLACAVDQSQGVLALELQGTQVDELMVRMVDVLALPMKPGAATRARLADIAVTLVRQQPDTLWLLTDQCHEAYLTSWLAYAGAAMARTSPQPISVYPSSR